MRTLESLTDDELIELAALCGFKEDELLHKTEEDIEFGLSDMYFDEDGIKGEKIIRTEHLDSIRIYYSWSQQNMDDCDAGVGMLDITIGCVSNIYQVYINPIKVIEWFLSKGFEVGNLILKN